MRNPNLTPPEKCLILDLYLYAGVKGEAYPSEIQLGIDLGITDRHIRTLLKNVREKGWIVGWKKRGYSKSNIYSLNQELYFHNDHTFRNPTSTLSGIPLPVQNGTPLPPKVSHERNQLSSSQVLQLFEKTSHTRLTPTNHRRLQGLCDKYTTSWAEEAIKEVANRRLPYIKVGLVASVLEDWAKDGKPQPKPEFRPCNTEGCENGFIFVKGVAKPCKCRGLYEEKLKHWENSEKITTNKT